MIHVGILGATGYTAVELMKILTRHPDVTIEVVSSRHEGNPHVAMIHPQLAGRLDVRLENIPPATVASRCEVVFSCLPHAASAEAILPMLDQTRVIDLSADFRLWDADVYAQWYGSRHPDAAQLGRVPYGLPEIFRELIAQAGFVANPGCYPTGAILAVAPFLKSGQVECDVIIDSKSGVSGAGRSPKLTTHYPECNESVSAYNVGRHRHTPEIAQILQHVYKQPIRLVFTPHLIPMDRGILTTAYLRPRGTLTEQDALSTLREFYAAEPFVRVVNHLPATKDVSGTNFCDVTARLAGDYLVVISCIDNLIKGAAGAAIQNMNLMFELPETTAL